MLGGRTRARTWDPLIKRHAAGIDFSREFSQPSQNPSIRDQRLTVKNPTKRARHPWRIDGPAARFFRLVERPLHDRRHRSLALRRQRSHVRIVSGVPDFLCFTARYALSEKKLQRWLIRASKQFEEKSSLSANSLATGFLWLFGHSEIGFARKQSIAAN